MGRSMFAPMESGGTIIRDAIDMSDVTATATNKGDIR